MKQYLETFCSSYEQLYILVAYNKEDVTSLLKKHNKEDDGENTRLVEVTFTAVFLILRVADVMYMEWYIAITLFTLLTNYMFVCLCYVHHWCITGKCQMVRN